MTAETLDLTVGADLWFEGDRWVVAEHEGATVRLTHGDQVRRVAVASLIGSATPFDEPEVSSSEKSELDVTLLSALPKAKREKAIHQSEVIAQAITDGATSGDMGEAYAAAAALLDVSERTLYRMVANYRKQGPAGLVDARTLRDTRRSIDPAWDEICTAVLVSYRDRSTPSRKTVIRETNKTYRSKHPERQVPSDASAYRRVKELDTGRYTFGDAKQRRSVAHRPAPPYGRLKALRPGEFFVLDTNRLDVFAMEPVSGRWTNVELTVAMDARTRCAGGLRLRPVAARSMDVASVIHQTLTPQQWGRKPDSPVGPYAGVPDQIGPDLSMVPDTIVVDHGKVYLSEHVLSVCDRLGINVQPARPYTPTDKPIIERFFRTLRQGLLEHLPAYKGPDIASRGKDIESGAFYYVTELEQLIREWVGIYHETPHDGLCDPHLPHVNLTPRQMFERDMAQSGVLRIPATQDLAMEFLEVEWRGIHHYGVDVNSMRYDGPGLNAYRAKKSDYGGAHPGKWPIMVDRDDVRFVYFKDPVSGLWHQLEWEHAHAINAPFSADAAAYTRRVSIQDPRLADPADALDELLAAWSKQAVIERRDRVLAQRLSAQGAADSEPGADPRETASVPGVISLLERRRNRDEPAITDDTDVFDAYYADNPGGPMGVFED